MNGIYVVTAALALASALCVYGMTRATDDDWATAALLAAVVFGVLLLVLLVGCWSLTVHDTCQGEPGCSVRIIPDAQKANPDEG